MTETPEILLTKQNFPYICLKFSRKNPINMKNNIKTIKFNISTQLRIRKMTRKQLCSTLGVNINYISQLREGTPIHKLITIANAIGCTPSELLEGL